MYTDTVCLTYRMASRERKLCTPVVTQLGYAGGMTELEKGPQGRRRGRGARERILSASQQLFRDQGINRTGMDQLCAAAQVSKRTAYQHFTGKDELVAEYLRRFDPDVTGGVFDRTDLTPRERLLAAFEVPATGTQDITPCAPTSRRPSKSTTLSTPHANTHATTRKPSPRGSPKPPAKPAPPTPNSSASNWRCSSTAPRPAPGSSTPNPSPPPPPSPPSSSTTPSPRQPSGEAGYTTTAMRAELCRISTRQSAARQAQWHHDECACHRADRLHD